MKILSLISHQCSINCNFYLLPIALGSLTAYSETERLGITINAWVEWILTSVIVGIIVTLIHAHRTKPNYLSIFGSRLSMGASSTTGPRLTILNGSDQGKIIGLLDSEVLFGSGWPSDFRLTGKNIQRKHARLRVKADKVILENLSGSELLVNGRPIRHLRLIGNNTVIQLGEMQLLFECGEQ
jgi:hypothetical protein